MGLLVGFDYPGTIRHKSNSDKSLIAVDHWSHCASHGDRLYALRIGQPHLSAVGSPARESAHMELDRTNLRHQRYRLRQNCCHRLSTADTRTQLDLEESRLVSLLHCYQQRSHQY